MLAEEQMLMHRVQRIHLIGIAGAGMSGIAEVLSNLGYDVSGSDLLESDIVRRLRTAGITVSIGHRAENVRDADVVVFSSAISDSNPELQVARGRRIPTVPRAEMLAELMRFRRGIAVAGTHGKTTTTSLLATVLAEAGLDPTFVVGGMVRGIESNARLGQGSYLVAEADESDASFLLLHPLMTVLTNIDADHMETYEGDFSVLRATFIEFLRRLPFYGVACVCVDDEHASSILDDIRARVITYGLSPVADVRGSDLRLVDGQEHFRVTLKDTNSVFECVLNLPGEHNVQNALAAIAVAIELGVDPSAIQRALLSFQGIGRRCQIHDDVSINGQSVTVVDDYGHHPKELAAVFATIRRCWPERRLVVVFQPHRFSRTQALMDDFAAVLSYADVLILLEVYAAGETRRPGSDGRALSRAIRTRGRVEPVFVDDVEDVPSVMGELVHDGDVVALLGAGNIGALAERVVQ